MSLIPRMVWCLLALHSADGSEIWLESASITVIKRGEPYHDHVSKAAGSIVYTVSGKTFGLQERESEVVRMMQACK